MTWLVYLLKLCEKCPETSIMVNLLKLACMQLAHFNALLYELDKLYTRLTMT